jgi:hypothetical protein
MIKLTTSHCLLLMLIKRLTNNCFTDNLFRFELKLERLRKCEAVNSNFQNVYSMLLAGLKGYLMYKLVKTKN